MELEVVDLSATKCDVLESNLLRIMAPRISLYCDSTI